MKRFMRLPSPAMIVAICALIAALGGTAVAGGFLSVKQFRNQSVRGPIQYASGTISVPPGGVANVSAVCPAGTKTLGGGIRVGSDTYLIVNDSHPTASGWAGTVFSGASYVSFTAYAYAICAYVSNAAGSVPLYSNDAQERANDPGGRPTRP